MQEATGNEKIVLLSLGSNLGDRLLYLKGALQELQRHESIRLQLVSSVYETDPVGWADQPVFLNIVVQIATSLNPLDLLAVCQDVENRFQRDRTQHWGPRTLDIDLIEYEGVVMDTPELTLPHPHMSEREFVQIPLQEIRGGGVGCSASVRPFISNWYPL
ncbi:MAG: 2-amino-4-hydroxy-6-hydroxymethyldihydropteridine diphosphokinase [Saccharofermentanales bacterium]|jgi:2-amino-4-hydroxy-6-hydroxymethyldihydropteridine diphosphokinase|nr:2-amino-4-hydroxy-6-hydroxymethyldihydropteridine diphosphokinase [Clostridiaceae bacterium]